MGDHFEHSLTFDAEFECGNLLRAVQRSEASYDLFLRSGETHSDSDRDIHRPLHCTVLCCSCDLGSHYVSYYTLDWVFSTATSCPMQYPQETWNPITPSSISTLLTVPHPTLPYPTLPYSTLPPISPPFLSRLTNAPHTDLHTEGNTQWFYFAISNTHNSAMVKISEQGVQVPSVRVQFNIVNLTKPDSLFNSGECLI